MPVSISGLSSDIDTQGIVNKLVEVERRPIERLQYEKQEKEYQKKTWNQLKEKLKKFDTTLQKLYGHNRIFRKRKFISDSEEYFTALAKDNADKGEHKIQVDQLAAAHKITTDQIPADKQLSGSTFSIQIGKDTVKIDNFKNGGTIEKLIEVLQNDADTIVKIQKVKSDENNIILSIESKKTGRLNDIKLSPETASDNKLFDELGLFRTEEPIALHFDFNNKTPQQLKFDDNGFNNTPALLIQKKSPSALSINKKISEGSLDFMYKSVSPPAVDISGNLIKKRSIDEVTIKDVTILGADLILNKIKEVETVDKGEAQLQIELENNDMITIDLPASGNWAQIKKELDRDSGIKNLTFINNSEDHYLVDDIRIFEKETDKTAYKNVVTEPQDAKLKMDGVELTRDRNNNLEDVIDGANLNLHKKTPEEVKVAISEDKEEIEKSLMDFIKEYNDVIDFIKKNGKNPQAKKPGEKNLEKGILSNDFSLMNLHSKMRGTVLNSYTTSLGNKLSILAQIGISTGKWGSAWENIQKGLLILDNEKFDLAINSMGDQISEIFGYDANNDKKLDTGVAFTLDNIIQPFINSRGIISGKMDLADALIRSTDKNIERKEKMLETYRRNLEHKFGKMEQGLQQLKASQKTLDNQINTLPGNSPSGKKKEE
ncbi:MAG: flagellar filament capping protein FliD [Spirochaetes bacterium]|nr:flagellar filament capping protein FliD [Spirochaetota bacterium]